MLKNTSTFVAGLASLWLVMAGNAVAKPSADEGVPVATPPGVTVQLVGRVTFGLIIGYGLERVQQFAYADAKGMTLYTYGKDAETPGKSACTGECATAWPPLAPAPGAKPHGPWTIVNRDDGMKQWALRGKPLYRFAKDIKISDNAGRGLDQGNWQIALFDPAAGISLPPGIGVDEIPDANGIALVNAKGMAIYAFDGNINRDQPACAPPCTAKWVPVPAPELADRVGDFTAVTRPDMTRQWAYKGKPLFSYDADMETGFAAGLGVDKKTSPVVVVRYFMPPGVSVHPTLSQGHVLTTGDGKTLYRHDTYVYQLGGHGLRRGVPPRPHVGRDIGVQNCDAECLQSYKPLKAAADALPSGLWSIIDRDDGTRQWTYKGYALYNFAGDKRPGDLLGNDQYKFMISEDPQKQQINPSRMTAAGAMYWIYAYP